jgi:hypothetical protein
MPGGKKVWRLRYWLNGKQEKITLGGYPVISLVEARKRREEAKAAVHKGRLAYEGQAGGESLRT